MGDIGRNFEADEAVGALRRFVNRTQHIGGVLDVLDGKPLVKRHYVAVAFSDQGADRCVVIAAVADRLFEDGGVGRDSGKPVFLYQLFQAAFGNEAAGEEIEPYGLAMLTQQYQRVHDEFPYAVRSVASLRQAHARR